MIDAEIAIWAAMSGVLMCLMLMALGRALTRRDLATWRMAIFVLTAGLSCVLMSGLLEQFLAPGVLPWLLPFKLALAPASSALALGYLVNWSMLSSEDRLVRSIQHGGVPALWLCSAALLVWGALGAPPEAGVLASGVVVSLATIQGGMVVGRGVIMGDRSSLAMTVALLALAVVVPGLHARALGLCESAQMCALTAFSAVVYFGVVLQVGYQRIRQQSALRRQAAGVLPNLSNASLPRGVGLVEQVEATLWRSKRMERPCFVAAAVVPNLYALGDRAPGGMEHDAEVSILLTLAARIRRVVGFRNLVGLYHQRCFILGVSAVQDRRRGEIMAGQLTQALRQAINFSPDSLVLPFEPDIALGIVRIEPDEATPDAVTVMNLAEQLAIEAMGQPGRVLHGLPGARSPAPQGLPDWDGPTQPDALPV